MNNDLEERLSRDLPTLADSLLQPPNEKDNPQPSPTRSVAKRSNNGRRSFALVAAAIVLAVGAGVWIANRDQQQVDVSKPPTTDTSIGNGRWQEISEAPIAARSGHLAVWTGAEVLIWGGHVDSGSFDQRAAAYYVSNDSWSEIAASASAHPAARGVWIGEELAVLSKLNGEVYDRLADSWQDLPRAGGFSAGFRSAFWDGSRIIGAGWFGSTRGNAQVAFIEPGSDKWRTGTALSDSRLSDDATAVMVGDDIMFWDQTFGWRYSITDDRWEQLPELFEPDGLEITEVVVGEVDGDLVAIANIDNSEVGSAALTAEGWQWLPTRLEDTTITVGLPEVMTPTGAIASSGTAVVAPAADATGAPTIIAASKTELTLLEGFPLDSVVGQAAVWTPNGLVVWGGRRADGSRTDKGAIWRPEPTTVFNCASDSTTFSKSEITAQADGVHIDFNNRMNEPTGFSILGDGLNRGGSLPAGRTIQVLDLPPGSYEFFCNSDGRTTSEGAEVVVSDPDNHYSSPDLDCEANETESGVPDNDPDEHFGPIPSEAAVNALTEVAGIERVERTGYPNSPFGHWHGLNSDGRAVARAITTPNQDRINDRVDYSAFVHTICHIRGS